MAACAGCRWQAAMLRTAVSALVANGPSRYFSPLDMQWGCAGSHRTSLAITRLPPLGATCPGWSASPQSPPPHWCDDPLLGRRGAVVGWVGMLPPPQSSPSPMLPFGVRRGRETKVGSQSRSGQSRPFPCPDGQSPYLALLTHTPTHVRFKQLNCLFPQLCFHRGISTAVYNVVSTARAAGTASAGAGGERRAKHERRAT